jgi:hypothetical protein
MIKNTVINVLSVLIVLITLVGFIPNPVFAQPGVPVDAARVTYEAVCTSGRFVTCDGTDKCPCSFGSLMQLIDNVLNFLTNYIAIPLAIVTFMYAGFLFMTSAVNPGQRSQAKTMMVKVVKGFVVLLAANLIVKTVLGVLLDQSIFDKIFTF